MGDTYVGRGALPMPWKETHVVDQRMELIVGREPDLVREAVREHLREVLEQEMTAAVDAKQG